MTDIYIMAKKEKESKKRKKTSSSGLLTKLLGFFSTEKNKKPQKKQKNEKKPKKSKKPLPSFLFSKKSKNETSPKSDKAQKKSVATEKKEIIEDADGVIDDEMAIEEVELEDDFEEEIEKEETAGAKSSLLNMFSKKKSKKKPAPQNFQKKKKIKSDKKKNNLRNFLIVLGVMAAIAFFFQSRANNNQQKTIPLKSQTSQKSAESVKKNPPKAKTNKNTKNVSYDEDYIRAKKRIGAFLVGKKKEIGIAKGAAFLRIGGSLTFGTQDTIQDVGNVGVRSSGLRLDCGNSLETTRITIPLYYKNKEIYSLSVLLRQKHPKFFFDGVELDNDQTKERDFYYPGDSIVNGLKLKEVIPVGEDKAKFVFECDKKTITETRTVEE